MFAPLVRFPLKVYGPDGGEFGWCSTCHVSERKGRTTLVISLKVMCLSVEQELGVGSEVVVRFLEIIESLVPIQHQEKVNITAMQ